MRFAAAWKGLRRSRIVRRNGEKRGDGDIERRRETVQQIDRGVALLSLKIAQPMPPDPRIYGEPLLGETARGAKSAHIPCQE